MVFELFKLFIYLCFEVKGLFLIVKQVKKLVEKECLEVWDIFDEVICEYFVLLNCVFMLYCLGIQVFEFMLIEGKVIQLYLLVCLVFNVDFDGDQMVVYVLLSFEVQLEVCVLMMLINNVLLLVNGVLIIVLLQDMILGLYYIIIQCDGQKGEGMLFVNFEEVEYVLVVGEVYLYLKIIVWIKQIDDEGNEYLKCVEIMLGCLCFGNLLLLNVKVLFDLVN